MKVPLNTMFYSKLNKCKSAKKLCNISIGKVILKSSNCSANKQTKI